MLDNHFLTLLKIKDFQMYIFYFKCVDIFQHIIGVRVLLSFILFKHSNVYECIAKQIGYMLIGRV